MKSKLRLGILTLIAALIFSPALMNTVHAQGTTNCYGLADADCALITAAGDSAAMQKLTSFQMDYKMSLTTTGTGTSDADVQVTGTGPFAVDTKAMSANGSSSNPLAALAAIQAANVIKASVKSGTTNMSGTFEWRFTQANIYFMGDMATGGQWKYISVNDLATAAMSMNSSSSAGGAGGGISNSAQTLFSDPDFQKALGSIATTPGVLKATAADGPAIDGAATRAITLNIDLVTLLQSKDFRPAILAIAKSNSATVTDAQVDTIIAKASTALKNSKLSFGWLIGKDDKVFHGFNMDVNLAIDKATGASLGSPMPNDVSLAFHFDIQLSKVGQPQTVAPGPNAVQIDPSTMMGGAASGSVPPMAPTAVK